VLAMISDQQFNRLRDISVYELPLNIRYATKIAERLGLAAEQLDPFSGYLLRITDGRKPVFVGAGNVSGYPLNGAGIANLVSDKTHTYQLLASIGVPAPRSQLVFLSDKFADLRPEGLDRRAGIAFAEQLGFPVFVKPNEGSRGKYARSVRDAAALESHFTTIATAFNTAVVQEYLPGREARLFAIDGVPKYFYEKVPAMLTGDGASSIGALLDRADQAAFGQGLPPQARDNPVLAAAMAGRNYAFSSILAAGETLAFSETANAASGGGARGFRTTFEAEEKALSARIFEATGLRVAAIDLVFAEDRPGAPPYVLEINANPTLKTLEALGEIQLLDEIWTEILTKAFEA
jgi:glutathione synthase/RimK-type ligase-like ATP-grasp enzyme